MYSCGIVHANGQNIKVCRRYLFLELQGVSEEVPHAYTRETICKSIKGKLMMKSGYLQLVYPKAGCHWVVDSCLPVDFLPCSTGVVPHSRCSRLLVDLLPCSWGVVPHSR
jgi:hypothetical protein